MQTNHGQLFSLDAQKLELLRGRLAESMAKVEKGSFSDYLNQCAVPMGDVINSFIPKGSHPDMWTYLYGPLTKYSQNAGKRHRPLICALGAVAVGGDWRKSLSAGAAIEHFHTAALIHDDIADEAELRRGEPCFHLTEGEGLAINAGDLGLAVVNGIVMCDPLLTDTEKVRVSLELVSMACSTVEGQALDIGWARDNRYDLTVDDYLLMARHKTAYYSGGVPLAIGAIVGGGTEEQVEGLRRFGMATGLAFQIQDDLLNLVGTKEAKEKDYRSDITEGKRTLVAVHALAHSKDRDRLESILSSKEKNPEILAEAVAIMQEAGSIDYARSFARELVADAKADLATFLDKSEAYDLLVSMADWFVSRLK